MGLFSKLVKPETKIDPIVTALQNIGSNDEKTRAAAAKKLLSTGPNIIPVLVGVIEDRRLEDEWARAQQPLDPLDSNVRVGIRRLIADLHSSSPAEQKSAQQKLKRLPKESRSYILSLSQLKNLVEINRRQRTSAIELLDKVDLPTDYLPKIVGVLVNLVHEEYEISNAAQIFLIQNGEQIQPYLLAFLTLKTPTSDYPSLNLGTNPPSAMKRENDKRVIFILKTLKESRIPYQEAVPILVDILNSDNRDAWLIVLDILGNMGSLAVGAIPALLDWRHFSDEFRWVKETLIKIGSTRIESLFPGLTHPSGGVRYIVSGILGSFGAAAKTALPGLYNLLHDEDSHVRTSAAQSIQSIGPDREGAGPLLTALSEEDYSTIQAIQGALASLGTEILPELVDKLHSPSAIIRKNAALTLALMKDQALEVLPNLEEALEDGDSEVRKSVITAIGKIGPAARRLAPKLHDLYNQFGDQTVLEALCSLNDPLAIDIVLQNAFDAPSNGRSSRLKSCLMKFLESTQLTEAIIDWALDAATYEHLYNGFKYDEGFISLVLSNRAIQSLCEIKSSLTSNILHHVTKKHDISVMMDNGCGTCHKNTVSFKAQRDMATKELAARGNPPYDMMLFLKANPSEQLLQQTAEQVERERTLRYQRLLLNAQSKDRDIINKWHAYEELVKEFKTAEAFQLLVRDLLRYGNIPADQLLRLEDLMVECSEGLSRDELLNLLAPIQTLWPDAYSSVIRRAGTR